MEQDKIPFVDTLDGYKDAAGAIKQLRAAFGLPTDESDDESRFIKLSADDVRSCMAPFGNFSYLLSDADILHLQNGGVLGQRGEYGILIAHERILNDSIGGTAEAPYAGTQQEEGNDMKNF